MERECVIHSNLELRFWWTGVTIAVLFSPITSHITQCGNPSRDIPSKIEHLHSVYPFIVAEMTCPKITDVTLLVSSFR